MYSTENASLKHSKQVSLLAGLLIGVGWYVYIDSVIWAETKETSDVITYSWLMGVLSSFGLLLLNSFEWRAIIPSYANTYNDKSIVAKAQCVVIFSVLLFFIAIGGSIAILVTQYIQKHPVEGAYPGVALIIQNFLITIGGIIIRFSSMNI